MKKKLLIGVLAFSFAFTGCAASSSQTAGDTSTAAEAKADAVEKEEEELEEDAGAEADTVASADLKLDVSDKSLSDSKASDFVKTPDYKNIKLSLPEDTVAESGMTANIAFAGTVQGEDAPRDGMTSDSYDLVLGSGSFIDGFEDALIGHKAGDVVEFTIPFPENYGEQTLAGKQTDWKVTIHSLANGTAGEAFNDLINNAEISSLPKDLYDKTTEYVTDIYSSSASSSGVELEEFLKANGIDMESVIRGEVRAWLTSLAILDAEGISEDSSEYTSLQADFLSANGYQTAEEAEKAGINKAYLDSLTARQLAMRIVQDNAK